MLSPEEETMQEKDQEQLVVIEEVELKNQKVMKEVHQSDQAQRMLEMRERLQIPPEEKEKEVKKMKNLMDSQEEKYLEKVKP